MPPISHLIPCKAVFNNSSPVEMEYEKTESSPPPNGGKFLADRHMQTFQ